MKGLKPLSPKLSLAFALPQQPKIKQLEQIDRQLFSSVLNCLTNLYGNSTYFSNDLIQQFGERNFFKSYCQTHKLNIKLNNPNLVNQIGNVLKALNKYAQGRSLSESQKSIIQHFVDLFTMHREELALSLQHSTPDFSKSILVQFAKVNGVKKENGVDLMDMGQPFDRPSKNGLKKF